MRGLLAGRSVAFADAIASRFAYWIINRKGPPDAAMREALERERRRYLQRIGVEIAFFLALWVAMAVLLPDWIVIVTALVLIMVLPRGWLLARELVATPALFRPAEAVPGLLDEVARACEASEAAATYFREVKRQRRPLMRVEALALVTVPRLDEKDWLEAAGKG
ncbi:MAG: hypothetical protein JJT90_11795 [Ectothiorhodospiraceae bacterium]|nr:hypothetical protein [Ectothiorhodospiraceae bacterium]